LFAVLLGEQVIVRFLFRSRCSYGKSWPGIVVHIAWEPRVRLGKVYEEDGGGHHKGLFVQLAVCMFNKTQIFYFTGVFIVVRGGRGVTWLPRSTNWHFSFDFAKSHWLPLATSRQHFSLVQSQIEQESSLSI